MRLMVENLVMHGFKSLRVEGSIFPTDYLQTIAELKAPGQNGLDYGLDETRSISDAVDQHWQSARRDFVDMTMTADKHSRDWLENALFARILGYRDLSATGNITHEDRVYKLTHSALNGSVPFLFVPNVVNLDTAGLEYGYHPEGRQSPHGLIQEFLNAREESLWGIVSNGTKLRLLRDNASITRPSYIEADIERMFADDLFPDFRLLWLVAHATRLEPKEGRTSKCIIETWRDKAHEIGVRALQDLRFGVQNAIKELGNGLLNNGANDELRNAVKEQISRERFMQELLKLVYRLLFLLTTEEQDILHTPDATDAQRQLYADGYSLKRLRNKSRRRRNDDKHTDLWIGLQIIFKALSKGTRDLGLPGLGGLFKENPDFSFRNCYISNCRLLAAIRSLCFLRKGDVYPSVDYQNMNTEELGSVYESLLELTPEITAGTTPDTWRMGFIGDNESSKTTGSVRKLTGSYYTPPSLVSELIKSTLEPVIEKKIENSTERRKDLLQLKVLDPACGSGHFLLAAARRIADEILKSDKRTDDLDVSSRKHALREVVQNCIFGVDKNPLAVELCKAALWIEAVEPGKPLTFLDSHIKLGDSLVGLLDPAVLNEGIPKEAYKPLTGDDKDICASLRKESKTNQKWQKDLLYDTKSVSEFYKSAENFYKMPENTLTESQQKQANWNAFLESPIRQVELLQANLFVGAFYAEKQKDNSELVPISQDIIGVKNDQIKPGLKDYVEHLSTANTFFHWYLEFPDIMQKGGFDVVLGNPPWERIKLIEKEFFASKSPSIAGAKTKAERERKIKKLGEEDATDAETVLYSEYLIAKRGAQAASNYIRNGNKFFYTGIGDINTYPLFAELCYRLVSPTGRAGIIVPTGIATDDTTKTFFNELVASKRLTSLFDFENRKKLFPDIDSRLKFSLLTMSGEKVVDDKSEFAFYLHKAEDLGERGRRFTLTDEDFALFNPNTLTCPVFRSSAEMKINRKIYSHIGCVLWENDINESSNNNGENDTNTKLWNEDGEGETDNNPWRISFQRMFDMSNDSKLFKSREELENLGFQLIDNIFIKGEVIFLPLYEAKLFHRYDHRYATFEGNVGTGGKTKMPRVTTSEEKKDFKKVIIPQHWINKEEVLSKHPPPPHAEMLKQRRRLTTHYRSNQQSNSNLRSHCILRAGEHSSSHQGQRFMIALRLVARATDIRTVISSCLTLTGLGNTAARIAIASGCWQHEKSQAQQTKKPA